MTLFRKESEVVEDEGERKVLAKGDSCFHLEEEGWRKIGKQLRSISWNQTGHTRRGEEKKRLASPVITANAPSNSMKYFSKAFPTSKS